MAWLTAFDHQLFFAIHHLQKFKLDFLLAWPTFLGSLWTALPLLFLLIVLQSRSRLRQRSFAAMLPLLLSHYFVDFFKIFFERQRPFSLFADKPDAVNVIFDPPSSFSFPSGHASNAFALAVVLSAYLNVPRPLAYGLAVLIALTRPYIGVHFPSDILIGGLWGFLFTAVWVRVLKSRGFVWQPA